MGLGKTRTSLAKAEEDGLRELWKNKLLIICMAGTKKIGKTKDWYDEVTKWWPSEKPMLLVEGVKKGQRLDDNMADWSDPSRVVIISFESSWRLQEQLFKWVDENTWIIVDESWKMKGRSAKVSKFLMSLSFLTNNKMLLAGTPMKKNYEDYFTQLVFMGWRGTRNTTSVAALWKEFKKRFCIEELMQRNIGGGRTNYFREIIGFKNTEELMALVHEYAIFMRSEDAIDLPDKVFTDVMITKNKWYNIYKRDRVMDEYASYSPGTLRMRLKQLCSGVMGDRTGFHHYHDHKEKQLEQDLISNNRRVVVFYNYVAELESIAEVCEKLNRPFSIFGGTGKDRTNFDKCEDGVIAVQYQSGGAGIELHDSKEAPGAKVVIFYGPPDSYGDYVQAIKRVHRIGVTEKVYYRRYITLASVEVKIYEALAEGKDYDDMMFEYDLEQNKI